MVGVSVCLSERETERHVCVSVRVYLHTYMHAIL